MIMRVPVLSRMLGAIALMALPPAAHAQAPHVSLAITNGGVVLDARDVTLQRILEEWQQVGGVRVMNLDKLRATRITLLMKDVSEREALDTLLRDVGYVLSSRGANQSGPSAFGTIVLVPAGAAPAESAAASNDRTTPPAVAPGGRQAYVEEPGEPAAVVANVIVPPDQRPPTPIMRPPSAPTQGNPFGTAAGAARPGEMTGAPPEGVAYPRQTNPDMAPGGSSAVKLK